MYAQHDPVLGREIDGYRILEVLGRGGMGIVYRAEDVALSRTVALKVIDPALARDENFLRRFQAEARALARIDSPFIVRVHALRHTEVGSFIVMEYVDGGTLADVIAGGTLSWQQALPIIKQVLQALDHAHSVGVIHRDIKPSNIMLTRDGAVKVTDFGLAKMETSPDATVTKGIAGTLAYMSPEQVKGSQELDHRSDLYSFGMTAYEMLTGQPAFPKGGTEFEIMRAIVEQEPPPADRLRPDLPSGLVQIVMKALQKQPARRFESARAMLEAIEAFEQATGGASPGTSLPGATPARTARRLSPAIAAGAVLLLVAAGVLVYALRGDAGADEAPPIVASDERADTVATEPAGSADERFALLEVTSSPDRAEVWVNGTRVGQTPYRSDRIEPGTVMVRIMKTGFEAWEQRRDVAPGDNVVLSAALQPLSADPVPTVPSTTPSGGGAPARGTLLLRAVPRGTVLVDGQVVDATGPIRVDAGRRTVTCGTAPFRADTTLTVRDGQTVAATCFFESAVNVVAVAEDGTTPFATVWINGENTGQYTGSLRLGPGRYRITVRRDGFETLDEEKTITIRPGFTEQVHRLVFRVRRAPAG